MKTRCVSVLMCVVASLCFAQQTGVSVILRGRLLNQSSEGTYPAAHVSVYLKPIMRDAVTGQDGIFYFYKVPPGNYILEIHARQIVAYPIEVKPEPMGSSPAYHDIPEITLPR